MVLRIFFSFFILLSAQANIENRYGEINFDHYFGPSSPEFEIDNYNNELVFRDKYEEDIYIHSRVQNELFYLKKFLDVEFSIGLYCPDIEYEKTKDYFKYLIRLLTMSYLFEALREYEFTSKQLGTKNSCQVDWKEAFAVCQPQTKDMKIFLKNSKYVLKSIDEIIVPLNISTKSKRKEWIKDLNSGSFNYLSQLRLNEECKYSSCGNMNLKFTKQRLNQICKNDIELIKNICSEEDSLLGASYIPEIFPLIMRSNALRALKNPQYEKGCFRRFIESNQIKEKFYPELKSIFAFFYSKFLNKGLRLERGRLFTIGALKEFQDKGLNNIFKEEVKKIKIASVKIEKRRVKPKFEEIVLPTVIKTKKKKIKKVKASKKIDKPKVKRSSFFVAANFRRKFNLDKVDVDMNKMKYDYVFTLEQEKTFRPIVKKFSSHKSLKDMFQYDKLGSSKAPIPLKFVKFLIDKEMHQGLYNIINVIGESFYVKNDIDNNIDKLEKIIITNDRNTNHKWQITIQKGNTNKPDKK